MVLENNQIKNEKYQQENEQKVKAASVLN